ncbi:MAG: thioredoxin-related protein [Candidatus Endobugula sp.]|jgi:thioredoxin-related protein
MGKKKKEQHKKSNPSHKKPLNWKKWIKKGAIFFIFTVLIVGTIFIYIDNKKVGYDLSVIGNGTASVIQIHDHNCRLCRQLKSNLDSVKSEFKEDIQFKTANILSNKGAAFARKYQVPHVTLLFFDKKGKRVNMLQGVTSKENIKTALLSLARKR